MPNQSLPSKFFPHLPKRGATTTHGRNGRESSGKPERRRRSNLILKISFRRVDYGHEEVKVNFGKDPRQYSTTTKEFLDDGKGNLTGVNTVSVEWTKSPTGQWQMKEVAGSEKHYPAQLILLAMGFLGPEKVVPTEIGNVDCLSCKKHFFNKKKINFCRLATRRSRKHRNIDRPLRNIQPQSLCSR